MKTLLLSLITVCGLFGAQHSEHRFHERPPVVVVRPSVTFGGYYRPYYEPFYYNSFPTTVIVRPDACKKEKLKDSNGKKHDILVCRQPDGSFKVVADADHLNSR
jgi:hypothetical protein